MILCAPNPPDEVAIEGTSSNAVCSGLLHFGVFGRHLIESIEHAPDRLAVGLHEGLNISFKYSLVMYKGFFFVHQVKIMYYQK